MEATTVKAAKAGFGSAGPEHARCSRMSGKSVYFGILFLKLAAVFACFPEISSHLDAAPSVNGTYKHKTSTPSFDRFGFKPLFGNEKSRDYLEVGALPAIALSSSQGPYLEGPESGYVHRPTLGSFLEYLEEEREALAMARAAEEEALAATENDAEEERTTEAGKDPGNAEGALASGGVRSRTETVLQSVNPHSEKGLFPRPDPARLERDWLQLYFPLGTQDQTKAGILLPVNFDAAFLPPGTDGMRSSATLHLQR